MSARDFVTITHYAHSATHISIDDKECGVRIEAIFPESRPKTEYLMESMLKLYSETRIFFGLKGLDE